MIKSVKILWNSQILKMDLKKLLEENLREAVCFGDLEKVKELILKGVDVNSKNAVNGWTPLHWAARRNNVEMVNILLKNGADKTAVTCKGELSCDLTSSEIIKFVLGGKSFNRNEVLLPIVPNYLKNPPLLPKTDLKEVDILMKSETNISDVLVFKIRISDSADPDFIEVEFPKMELTYEMLKKRCCEELNIKLSEILKIRKLPNTIIRNNKDVEKLNDLQELEIVKSKT